MTEKNLPDTKLITKKKNILRINKNKFDNLDFTLKKKTGITNDQLAHQSAGYRVVNSLPCTVASFIAPPFIYV